MNEPTCRRVSGWLSLLGTVLYLFSAITYKTIPFTTRSLGEADLQYLFFFLIWTLISMIFLIPGLRLSIEWLKGFLIFIGMVYWLSLPVLFILAPAAGTSMGWRISVISSTFPPILSLFAALLLFAGSSIMALPSGVLFFASSVYYIKLFFSAAKGVLWLKESLLIFSFLMLIISVVEFYLFFLSPKK